MIAQTAVEFKVDGVRERLIDLEQWLAQAAQKGTGEHQVEGTCSGRCWPWGPNCWGPS